MSKPVFDPAELKKVGIIQQKQEDCFALRIRAVSGDFTSEQMRKVIEVAEKFGKGQVHLTTRQGIEVHHVRREDLEAARRELESAGISMGACGPKIRTIVGCPGEAVCKWGIIDTKEIAHELDRDYFGQDAPYKFKIAVTGCPRNCAKAHENDIGIMGGIEPAWEGSLCADCGLCVDLCPVRAIERCDDGYRIDQSMCINCGACTSGCPSEAWECAKKGYILWVGGTLGKMPRLATRIPELIESKERLYACIDKAIRYYRINGRKRERFGHTLDRMGVAKAFKIITS